MNKNKMWAAGFLAVALATGIPSSYAFHGSYGERSGSEDLAGKFFYKACGVLSQREALGLSDEQVNTLKNLKLDIQKNLIRQGAEIKILELELVSKLHNTPIDTGAVNKLIDQKYDLKKAVNKELVNAYAKLKSTLTEEQWAKFKELQYGRSSGVKNGGANDSACPMGTCPMDMKGKMKQ
ncbi:MAG: hypothetical protein HY586_06645 [Candidatus Omnitrophica bacterium]|nr:hypothetical protein [Candidatus Omnitrophota bacterium]